jgi:hypothetical protein
LTAIAAVLLLASCKPRTAGPSLSKALSEPPAPAVARPTAQQVADESLARALASPPGQNGMRLVSYCPLDEAMANDECFKNQVTAELIGDIGRRVRQGAGVLIVEAAAGSSPGQTAGCGAPVGVLAFKLAPTAVFPKGAIRPLLGSLCYSIVSQAKISDCQCQGNISKALSGLAAEAGSKGAVLGILDARRFGAWKSAAADDQDAATVDAPGFDLVYALIPKPKDFAAVSSLDFVSAETGAARAAGGTGGEAPPLRIELPAATTAPAVAAPAADADAKVNKATAASEAKKSDAKSDTQKSASKSGSKDKSKKKSTSKSKDKNKGKSKRKDKDKDKATLGSSGKRAGAAAQ